MERETMRLLPAAALLQIRREVMAMGLADELEQSLMGNAMVIAACCEKDGRPVFADGQAVLSRLTASQMERLLESMRQNDRSAAERTAKEEAANDGFDVERFLRMKEDGGGWTM